MEAAANVPCFLTDQGGGFYSAQSGTITLSLVNQVGGTTNFVCANCTVFVRTPHGQTSLSGTACTPTTFKFTLPEPAAGTTNTYRVQLAFVQIPAIGATADLIEAGCGQQLLQINPGRLVLQWQVTVTG